MARVVCIFCKTETDGLLSAGYCDGCGRKLPTSAMLATKRSINRTTEDGPAESNKPGGLSETMLFAAVVHLVGGGLFLVVGPALLAKVPTDFMARVMTWTLIPTLVVGLMIPFVRRWPVPVVSAALLLTGTWVVVTFALDPVIAIHWLAVQALLLVVLGYALFLAITRSR